MNIKARFIGAPCLGFSCPRLSPISESVYAHWAKSTELLDFDVIRAGSLQRWLQRLSRHLGFSHLGHAWMACRVCRRLCREPLFVGVELFLPPDVDLVFRSSRIHIVQFPVVLHGRDSAHG